MGRKWEEMPDGNLYISEWHMICGWPESLCHKQQTKFCVGGGHFFDAAFIPFMRIFRHFFDSSFFCSRSLRGAGGSV